MGEINLERKRILDYSAQLTRHTTPFRDAIYQTISKVMLPNPLLYTIGIALRHVVLLGNNKIVVCVSLVSSLSVCLGEVIVNLILPTDFI